MRPDPKLLSDRSLSGAALAVSVSDSADLDALGLHPTHLDLAVGEIARAVYLAGGQVVYGGRLPPSGFTEVLLTEALRYGRADHCLTLCVPLSEHIEASAEDLQNVDERLGTVGRLETLNADGVARPWSDFDRPGPAPDAQATAASLAAARQTISRESQARLVLGGRLEGHEGTAPGVLEEILDSLGDGRPVYLAAGFGGAAAAAARVVSPDLLAWLPEQMPFGKDNAVVAEMLAAISDLLNEETRSLVSPGLTAEERAVLTASHRPGEIASLTVLGLSRHLA